MEVSTDRVVLPRRPHTEEPEDVLEVSSDALLAMTDLELHGLLAQLGINLPMVQGQPGWSRDKMIDVVVTVALSARDG